MNRRDFLRSGALFGAGSLLPGWLRAEEDAYYTDFRKGLQAHPWLRAYAGVDRDLECGPVAFEGRLPRELRGVLYRNGPGLFERAGKRYHHWFDGDGMVQAYTFGDGVVSHRGRFVRTRKFLAESGQGRFLFPGFGTAGAMRLPPGGPDNFNPANTNVIVHANRVLALCEAGSAHELAAGTLETLGPVTWRPDLKGMPFSAHPIVEPDGTLWNFGAFDNKIALYRIGRDGTLAKAGIIEVPDVAMNHAFAVSARHLVFALPVVRLDRQKLRAGRSFVDSLEIPAHAAMRVLTIDKDDFSKRRMYELPPGFVFHYGNAWEDRDGVIRFDYVRFEDGARVITRSMRSLMRGDVGGIEPHRSYSTHVVIDPARGRIRQEAYPDDVEFPRVDPRVATRRNRHLFHAGALDRHGAHRFGLDSVLRYDLHAEKRDAFTFGGEYSLEEHVMVPRPGSTREGEGWLVGCAFNAQSGRTEVNVFDALNLADGPVAVAKLPYAIPLGFHGEFAFAA